MVYKKQIKVNFFHMKNHSDAMHCGLFLSIVSIDAHWLFAGTSETFLGHALDLGIVDLDSSKKWRMPFIHKVFHFLVPICEPEQMTSQCIPNILWMPTVPGVRLKCHYWK